MIHLWNAIHHNNAQIDHCGTKDKGSFSFHMKTTSTNQKEFECKTFERATLHANCSDYRLIYKFISAKIYFITVYYCISFGSLYFLFVYFWYIWPNMKYILFGKSCCKHPDRHKENNYFVNLHSHLATYAEAHVKTFRERTNHARNSLKKDQVFE